MLGIENTIYTINCEEDDDGNLILNIPDEILDAMGWGEGTVLDISAKQGEIVLREVTGNYSPETGDSLGRESEA